MMLCTSNREENTVHIASGADGMPCLNFVNLGAIRAHAANQDAEGSMRLFMWHKHQKAVSQCLTTILQMAQRRSTAARHEHRSVLISQADRMDAVGFLSLTLEQGRKEIYSSLAAN